MKKLDDNVREAWVDPYLWSTATYEQKQIVTFVLATYYKERMGGETEYVTVKDNMTGKRLAKWGVLGFSVD